MMTLFFECHIPLKKRKHLVLLTFLTALLIYLLAMPTEPVYEQRLFACEIRRYHSMLLERFLLSIAPVFTAYFAMEHDQDFMKPLIAYFGRLRIGLIKLLFFTYLVVCEFVIIASLFLVVPILFTEYAIYDPKTVFLLLHVMIDQIILLFLMLTLLKQRNKASVVFMLVFYQIVINTYEGISGDYAYVLPFHAQKMFEQRLFIHYKIAYAIGLGLIHMIKSLHTNVR